MAGLAASAAWQLGAEVDVMVPLALVADPLVVVDGAGPDGVSWPLADGAGLGQAVGGPVLHLAVETDRHLVVALYSQVVGLAAVLAGGVWADGGLVGALALEADEARVQGALAGEVTLGVALPAVEVRALPRMVIAFADGADDVTSLTSGKDFFHFCLPPQLCQHVLDVVRLGLLVRLVEKGVVFPLAPGHETLSVRRTDGHIVSVVETVDASQLGPRDDVHSVRRLHLDEGWTVPDRVARSRAADAALTSLSVFSFLSFDLFYVFSSLLSNFSFPELNVSFSLFLSLSFARSTFILLLLVEKISKVADDSFQICFFLNFLNVSNVLNSFFVVVETNRIENGPDRRRPKSVIDRNLFYFRLRFKIRLWF